MLVTTLPALPDLDPLVRDILLTTFFSPFPPGSATVDTVALQVRSPTPAIADALESMVALGLLRRSGSAPGLGVLYETLMGSWTLKERILRAQGRRLPQLAAGPDVPLKDVILAIAMAPVICDRQPTGGFIHAGEPMITMYEVSMYLSDVPGDNILATCIALKDEGYLHIWTTTKRRSPFPEIQITLPGQKHYDEVVRHRLSLSADQCILDLRSMESIDIFWAWQSDYGNSRNQIERVLESIVAEAQKDWRPVARISITTASAAGDGAIKIDAALLMKIRKAQIFVGDITAVLKWKGRLHPNPNVLIETGYALASKDAEQVFLIAQDRDPATIEGDEGGNPQFPFDIAPNRRIGYTTPAELRVRIRRELHAVLRRRMLVGVAALNAAP